MPNVAISTIHPTALPVVSPSCVRRSDGATAQLEEDSIVVRDPAGRALLSYGKNGVQLIAAQGDLTLSAPHGKVVIQAGSDIEVTAARKLAVLADTAELTSTTVTLAAHQLLSQCASAIHQVGRWELSARRIAEQAGDVYREVDGVLQTRAGRMRSLVSGACQLLAKRVSINCEEDVNIDGQRILLG